MTDTTQTPAAQAAPAPAVVEDDVFNLDQNINDFLSHRMDTPEDTPAPVREPVAEQTASPAVPLNPSPTPAPNAEPAAEPNEGGDAEVLDPNLMASVMLGTSPAQAPAPAAQPGAAAAPPSSGDDQPYFPIDAGKIKLPAAQLDAIFRSEDPVEQERALTGLMASWMNAGLSLMDQRIKEHYAPQFRQQAVQSFQTVQSAEAVEQDFYKDFPDLRACPQLVDRVGAHFAQKDPTAKWGPELKRKIGMNARALAKHMGIPLTGAPVPAAAPVQPFVADSARPQAPIGQTSGYTPQNLVDELSF